MPDQGIFLVEMSMKIYARGPKTYFKDKWNWIDFVVVMEAIITLILQVTHAIFPRKLAPGDR